MISVKKYIFFFCAYWNNLTGLDNWVAYDFGNITQKIFEYIYVYV